MRSHFLNAIYLITASVFMDGFDGTIARLTKTESDFGVQLDSLVDAVTFGLVTAVLIYKWGFEGSFFQLGPVIGFIFLSSGIIRLARFNILKEANAFPANIFVGLPIPFGALAICSMVLIFLHRPPTSRIGVLLFSLYSILISLLMISTIRYKTIKKFLLKNSLKTLLAMAGAVALLVMYPHYAIPVITYAYVLSPILFFFTGRRRRGVESGVEAKSAEPAKP